MGHPGECVLRLYDRSEAGGTIDDFARAQCRKSKKDVKGTVLFKLTEGSISTFCRLITTRKNVSKNTLHLGTSPSKKLQM
jgi:hypothetical protein